MSDSAASNPPKLALHEGVRRRPSMYFGFTDSGGIHEALKTLIETCVDEYREGHSTFIEVTLTRDGYAVISDDGHGVRIDAPPEFQGRTFLEVVLTEFLTEGFGVAKRCSYDILPAVPAVAADFRIETHRNGRCYRIGFTEGLLSDPFTDVGPSGRRGTTMRWKPDPTIFNSHVIDTSRLAGHLENLSAVYCGLKIHLHDESTGQSATYDCSNGVADLLRKRNADNRVCYPLLSIQMECADVKFDLAFQHVMDGPGWIHSLANGLVTIDGSHVRGFLSGLASSIRQIAAITGRTVDSGSVFVSRGLTAVLSIISENVQFEGPTMSVLNTPKIEAILARQVCTAVLDWHKNNPTLGLALVESVTGRQS